MTEYLKPTPPSGTPAVTPRVSRHDAHPTREVDQLSIIRELITRQDSRLQAIDAKVDASRAEAAARGLTQEGFNTRIEADVGAMRHEVRNLVGRVTDAEEQIRELRDQDAHLARDTSEHDLAHEAAIGGAIAHVRSLDQGFSEMRDKLLVQDRVDKALCEVMGVDYAAVAAPPQRDSLVVPPKASLMSVARENKIGAYAATLAFLTAVLELAFRVLGGH